MGRFWPVSPNSPAPAPGGGLAAFRPEPPDRGAIGDVQRSPASGAIAVDCPAGYKVDQPDCRRAAGRCRRRDLQLALSGRRTAGSGLRGELGDVVDDVLPDRLCKRVGALPRYRLYRWRDGSTSEGMCRAAACSSLRDLMVASTAPQAIVAQHQKQRHAQHRDPRIHARDGIAVGEFAGDPAHKAMLGPGRCLQARRSGAMRRIRRAQHREIAA